MDVLNQTKITLAWELYGAGLPKSHIASKLRVGRETVHLWIKNIQLLGLIEFLDLYNKAKKVSRVKRQVNMLHKVWVWEIREREMECCGQKIQYFLEKEHGIKLALSKIYEILSEKYIIRSKWKKNQVRGPIPKASKPREVIQMDTVDFGSIYAFTGIDIFTKEASVKLYPSLTAKDGLDFLNYSFTNQFNHTELLQADGGSEFKAEVRSNVFKFADRFRIARPYRKNEQAYIESFNRTVRKECLGWSKYQPDQIPKLTVIVNQFLDRYHYHRPHLGLNLKPPLERS